MKNLACSTILISLPLLFSACCKDDENFSPLTESFPNYSQLKVGNYWIYQLYDIDSNGFATPTTTFDSCYVEKDTLISGKTFFKMVRPSIVFNLQHTYLRDSLHYTIDSSGIKVFSSRDFISIFRTDYLFTGSGDTLGEISLKMEDQGYNVTTDAGSFATLNAQEKFTLFQPFFPVSENPRYRHTHYARNVGIVTETLPFYASNPSYSERRLVRYHVN